MALTQYTEPLATFACEAAKRLLATDGKLTPELEKFIDDVAVYVNCRVKNIFFDRDQPIADRGEIVRDGLVDDGHGLQRGEAHVRDGVAAEADERRHESRRDGRAA